MVHLIFPLVWIYGPPKSPINSIRMHFEANFRGVLDTTVDHRSALILGTLALE